MKTGIDFFCINSIIKIVLSKCTMGVLNDECTSEPNIAGHVCVETMDQALNFSTSTLPDKDSSVINGCNNNNTSKMEISSVVSVVSGEGHHHHNPRSTSPSGALALNLKTVTVSGGRSRSPSPSPYDQESQHSPITYSNTSSNLSNSNTNSRLLKVSASAPSSPSSMSPHSNNPSSSPVVNSNNDQSDSGTNLSAVSSREKVMKSPPVPIHPKRRHLNNLAHHHHHHFAGQNRRLVREESYNSLNEEDMMIHNHQHVHQHHQHHTHHHPAEEDGVDTPSSESEEAEVALDLSCHSKRSRGSVVAGREIDNSNMVRDLSSHHRRHHQLSTSSSKSSSSSSLCSDSISPVAMLAAARSAATAGIPPYIFDHRDSYERDSSSPQDSDDSDGQPMDLGINPKAYKKSLMKRYRKYKNSSFPSKKHIFWTHFTISLENHQK